VRFASVVPVKLHEKLLIREDVTGTSSHFTGVNFALGDVVLDIQDVSKPTLAFLGKVKIHLRRSEIPRNDGR